LTPESKARVRKNPIGEKRRAKANTMSARSN
jgi:hypothetical protein